MDKIYEYEIPMLQTLWSENYPKFSPAVWVSFIPLFCILSTYWVFGLLHLFLDVYKIPSFLYKYKLQKAERAQITPEQVSKLCRNVITSQLTLFLPVACAFYYTYTGDRAFGFRLDPKIPSLFEMVKDVLVFVVVEEVMFFYLHWALHHPLFYAKIHKVHHQFTAPVALACIYAHPFEVLFGNILPMITGPLLCHTHVLTYMLWGTLGIMVTSVHHCGYRFPWQPFFDHQPDFHDYHHEYFNRGNYGLLGILDYVHGTDKIWRDGLKNKKN